MDLTRRDLFKGASALGVGLALPATAAACAAPPLPKGLAGPFRHGVASGDPDTGSVVLWTRVDGLVGDGSTAVSWEMSTTPDMATIVRTGTTATGAERDGTVRVIATGLQPGTSYFYRFSTESGTSPVGRARTAPEGPASNLRLGVASCSNYAFGNFYLYRYLAERSDLDAVIHLGDYIYEYATAGAGETYGEFRELVPPNECRSLADYRLRYGHYRLDPDLQELHRQHTMIHVWDDHEFADDPFVGGASNHQPEDGPWELRKAAALQAYGEWMPTRLDGNTIYRTVDFGDLARLVLVDRQRKFLFPGPDDGDGYLDEPQFEWLEDQLRTAGTSWSLLGQASVFGSRTRDMVRGGWGAESRERVHTAVDASPSRSDLVVLGGDIHRAVAADLPRVPGVYDKSTGAGSAGVELETGSITSSGGDEPIESDQEHWNLGSYRTYLVLDITHERVQADFWGFPDTAKLLQWRGPHEWLTGWTTQKGANHLVSVPRAVTQGSRPLPAAP